MMAGAMGFIVWGWSKGRFSVGDVVLVNTLLAQLFRPLDLLGMVYRTIRQGLIDMEAMFDLVDTPAEVVDAPGRAGARRSSAGHVRFEDVRFGYDPEREILKGVDLEVPPGTTTGGGRPVGRGQVDARRGCCSASTSRPAGGSPSTGRISRRSRRRACARAIGIVPQDTVLFNDTIGYNIGYGREGATPGGDRGGGAGRGDPRLHRAPARGL